MLLITEGNTICKKIGNRGGVSEDRGIANTKVANRLQVSVSLILPEMRISDQRHRRNLVGDDTRRHLMMLRLGAFCAEAVVIALWMACLGCSSQVWMLAARTLAVSKKKGIF